MKKAKSNSSQNLLRDSPQSHSPSSVLITGASSGIGQATAILFAQKGYQIHLLGRDKNKLLATQRKCRFASPSPELSHPLWICDLASPTQVQKTVQRILKTTEHPLQVLVNNAGVFDRHAFEDPQSLKTWHKQFSINLMGAIHITQPLFSHFKQNKFGGAIINVSSTLGLKTAKGVSAYAAIKAAMINWTLSLALEGGEFGIRANCVCPGIVDTPIHSQPKETLSQKRKRIAAYDTFQPLGRVGQSAEIADAIYFLASSRSSWTTGAVLAVDGGINLV